MSISSGCVIWITGLSGAGKTTISKELKNIIISANIPIILLDGDELREIFSQLPQNKINTTSKQRLALAMQYAKLCQMLSIQGFNVIIATISLFNLVHQWNRENIPNFFEVYLNVPKDELEKRDPKGIYKLFKAGKITNVSGYDIITEAPLHPDLHLKFDPNQNANSIATKIYKQLREKRLL